MIAGKLKRITHADLAIKKTCTVGREEYLDYMTFQRIGLPLFTEIFGPIVGLKEEWEEQGATPEELDFSAFTYRCEARGHIPVNTGRLGGHAPYVIEETDEYVLSRIEEFIQPYYRRIWDMLADCGVRLFDQDSDGDMNAVIPAFLDVGVNCMHPMEPAANMDVVKIRERYGIRLAFYGGIDKHVLRRSREEIVAELEHKIPPIVATGGCVLALDHRIPNGTPLGNYRFYVQKAWEILNRSYEELVNA